MGTKKTYWKGIAEKNQTPEFLESNAKEFQDDLKRFKYIKRLLRKYYDTGILKERLLLNHIIVLKNVFGPEASTTLLLYKIQPDYWPALKSFLLFLNSITEHELPEVDVDNRILNALEQL